MINKNIRRGCEDEFESEVSREDAMRIYREGGGRSAC